MGCCDGPGDKALKVARSSPGSNACFLEVQMNKIIRLPLIVAFLLGISAVPLYAESQSWDIDKEHTNFYFSVDHIYSKVQGRFTDYQGTIDFNPENLNDSQISFEIKVKSIDTGLGKRDRHLRSADFFHASKFPLMTFISSSITRAEGDTFNVNGTLTIKDVSTELVLPLAFAGIRENPLAPDLEVAGFNGRLTLDRLAYNVGSGKYYKMGAVGKDVDILVTIEVLRKK